jgi:hypothetical protein
LLDDLSAGLSARANWSEPGPRMSTMMTDDGGIALVKFVRLSFQEVVSVPAQDGCAMRFGSDVTRHPRTAFTHPQHLKIHDRQSASFPKGSRLSVVPGPQTLVTSPTAPHHSRGVRLVVAVAGIVPAPQRR